MGPDKVGNVGPAEAGMVGKASDFENQSYQQPKLWAVWPPDKTSVFQMLSNCVSPSCLSRQERIWVGPGFGTEPMR